MIPYDIDRSLRSAEQVPLLDDGFSPPCSHGESVEVELPDAGGASLEEALAGKSDF